MNFMVFSKRLWRQQALKLFKTALLGNVSVSPLKGLEGKIYADTSEGMSIVSYRLTRGETNRATIVYQMVSGPDVLGDLPKVQS